MRSLDSNFIQEKNKRENSPIFLYTLYDYNGNGDNLYFASYDENIIFDGVTYNKSSIRHETISENSQGSIDQIQLVVANVSREIEYYLNEYDGLRGKKVSIKQVFLDTLSDPNAVFEDIFYIDYPSSNQDNIIFVASSKFDINNVTIPRRVYTRDNFPGIPSKRIYVI